MQREIITQHYTSIKLAQDLTLVGWSRGSQKTGFYVKELRLLLDTEIHPPFDPEVILITHVHTDHAFSLPNRIDHVSTIPHIFAPSESEGLLRNFVSAAFRMGHHSETEEVPFRLRGVQDRDTIQLRNGFFAEVFDMAHSIPCRGYGIAKATRKLNSEFAGLSRERILELKKRNVELSEEKIEHKFAYLTDTDTSIYVRDHERIFAYPFIITECTFINIAQQSQREDTSLELAKQSFHTHWLQLAPIIKAHPNNTFILIHFSYRYTDEMLAAFGESIKSEFPNVILFI